jgi:glyoxylase-like metal-dependent hydrolase (beta-lactamase superfamily II)
MPPERYENEKDMPQASQMAANHNAQPLTARVNIQVLQMRQRNVNSRFAASMEYGGKQDGGTHCLPRRRFIASAGILTAAAWLFPRQLFAEDENIVLAARKRAETANITVQALRGNVSALIGSGGNIAVLTGKDGKVIIDSGYATSRARINDALAKMDPSPIKHLVNTHWHFDHTDGNEWMHSEGATILAHENTRKHLSTTTRVEDWDFTFPPSPAGAIPTEVFDQEKTLYLNSTSIALSYYGPSHTDGDLSAYFAEADVLHTGDTWWNGHYPFIDYSTGGNIKGMIEAAEANLARVSDKTIVIPGHGKIGGKPEMTEYRDMLITIHDRVAALKKEGKSLEEIVAMKPTAAYDNKWAGSFITGDVFTKLVYAGA